MKAANRIAYNKEFDEKYAYGGKDLGALCTEEKTAFKVWSPLADKVMLRLYRSGNAGSDDCIGTMEMLPEEKGVWEKEISGDLHGVYYDYEVMRGSEKTVTADPYAVGCGCNGIRSMVTNLRLTDPEGFENDKAPALLKEQILYELHVKDFSYDPDSGVPEMYRGKYKAFTVKGKKGKFVTGVEYLKKLGITHVHLLPVYDFASLDESGCEDKFNWGYDPLNYNVPEGSFATDPFDGSVRIREYKEMIQALHQAGIRVVMDVVYNHTFSPDSWLERMVPGYYCRRFADGSLSNGSACGSDMAVGRAMVDNYITNSVLYWAREYHIDGFRFDLMGLLTTELMNRIRKELDAEYGEGEKILYGEPWRANESPMEEGTHPALKDNLEYLDENVAVFSDDIRDVIKGHVFYAKEPGFVNGAEHLEQKVLYAASAWRKGGACVKPKSASQIVSYVSAHDNFTLWDKLVLTMHDVGSVEDVLGKKDVFKAAQEDIVRANKLAAMMYFTFQGYIFFQAGEEFGRTKLGDENSYCSDPKINMLQWKRTRENEELLSYYKGLIRLRKKLPGLYDKSETAYLRIKDETVHKEKLVSFMVDNYGEDEDTKNAWSILFVVFNASMEEQNVSLPEGKWHILADENETDCVKEVVLSTEGTVAIPSLSGMIFGM